MQDTKSGSQRLVRTCVCPKLGVFTSVVLLGLLLLFLYLFVFAEKPHLTVLRGSLQVVHRDGNRLSCIKAACIFFLPLELSSSTISLALDTQLFCCCFGCHTLWWSGFTPGFILIDHS